MNVSANIANPGSLALSTREAEATPRVNGQDFESVLNGATPGKNHQELREAAQQLISHAFIMPMMKMMRNDPLRTDMFSGGRGEEVFGAQLDQHLAEGMGERMNFPLVDAVYERFASRLGPAAQTVGKEVDRHG